MVLLRLEEDKSPSVLFQELKERIEKSGNGLGDCGACVSSPRLRKYLKRCLHTSVEK